MSSIDMPQFPPVGARGPQVCETVRFYLAIVDELPFEQVSILSEHVQGCRSCAAEFRVLQQTTRIIASLPESAPAAHVDRAIQAALQRRGETSRASVQLYAKNQSPAEPLVRQVPARESASSLRRKVASLALAAALLLLVLAGTFLRGLIFPANSAQAFQLPNNLSWSGNVLHYTQTRTDSHGQSYQVEVYQDLGTNQMHIESSMQNQFDVIVVTDSQTMLGEDMMHHVAQIGGEAEAWSVDGSMFNLSRLRQDLTAHRTNYLGKESWRGQEVYLLQASNGRVLLLNMQYLPVNVLNGPNANISPYTTFALISSTQVSDSMWNMQVPPDFHMGQLPTRS